MKILNLYAGIGGNRKLWGDTHEITAVELDPKIAKIYQDFFPNDKVVVGDAHEYLLNHFKEFDFIWSSPPCPSHSKIRNEAGVGRGQNEIIYPDMALYQEIIMLKMFAKKQKWCIENVVSYYKPLIEPQKINLHYYWANFYIRPIQKTTRNHFASMSELVKFKGFDLSKYKGIDKRKTLRNCVEPESGLHILNEAFKSPKQSLF